METDEQRPHARCLPARAGAFGQPPVRLRIACRMIAYVWRPLAWRSGSTIWRSDCFSWKVWWHEFRIFGLQMASQAQ